MASYFHLTLHTYYSSCLYLLLHQKKKLAVFLLKLSTRNRVHGPADSPGRFTPHTHAPKGVLLNSASPDACEPSGRHLYHDRYVKEHISEISSQNAVHYTPSPPQKQAARKVIGLVTDSCIISIFHTTFVIPQAHSYVPSVAITSILVTAKILGVKFLNQHYKSPQCFALLSPLEQKFYQAVTRGSFRHIQNSHSIGTAYLRTRM